MKPLFLTAASLALACYSGLGFILHTLPTPRDDPQAHYQISKRDDLKLISTELWDLVENRVGPLRRSGIDRIFGPRLSEPPEDMVLPIFAPKDIVLDGTGKPEFHAIGSLGYIECYYSNHGDTNNLVQWGWFHRADDSFIPLTSAVDFAKRLEWDKAKLAEITKWLGERLPQFKDLGIVEVSAAAPTRLALGADKYCTFTSSILASAASTNYHYLVRVTSEWNPNQRSTRTLRKSFPSSNAVIGFSVDDSYYSATLKLIESPLKDLGLVELIDKMPTPLDLGGAREGSVTARLLDDGRLGLRFQFRVQDGIQTYGTWASKSGDSLCFTTAGAVFKLTPVLKAK